MGKGRQKADLSKILHRLQNAQDLTLIQVVNNIAEDVQAFMPIDSGKLQEYVELNIEGQHGKIAWSAPYARAVYYGEGSGRLWFERAKATNIDKWLGAATKTFRESL